MNIQNKINRIQERIAELEDQKIEIEILLKGYQETLLDLTPSGDSDLYDIDEEYDELMEED
jgi:hypothetical protein